MPFLSFGARRPVEPPDPPDAVEDAGVDDEESRRGVREASTENGEWHPDPSEATTGVEGRGVRGRSATLEDAEERLSSLYVSTERAFEKQRVESRQRERVVDEMGAEKDAEVEETRSKSWGATIVDGAVSATVLSAAIGLTAYRLWTEGWSAIPSREPAAPTVAERVSKFETASMAVSQVSVRSPPRKHRRRRTKRPSIADLITITSQSPHSKRTHQSPSTQTASSAAPITPLSLRPSSPRSTTSPSTSRAPLSALGESDDEDQEWDARIDSMARRIQGLINEGQRALSTPVASPRTFAEHSPIAPVPPLSPLPRPSSAAKSMRPSTMATSLPSSSSFPTGRVSVSSTRSESTSHIPRRVSLSSDMIQPTSSLSRSQAKEIAIGLGRPASSASSPASARSFSAPRGKYTQTIPPLPWRRESDGNRLRWVQRAVTPRAEVNGSDVEVRSRTMSSPSLSKGHSRAPSNSRIPQPQLRLDGTSTPVGSPAKANGRQATPSASPGSYSFPQHKTVNHRRPGSVSSLRQLASSSGSASGSGRE